MAMKWYDKLASALVSIGAINWGLIAFKGFNLVTAVTEKYANAVYYVVGVAGLYTGYFVVKGIKK